MGSISVYSGFVQLITIGETVGPLWRIEITYG
jgi:hypothetical protein